MRDASRLYGWLLKAYPARFREEFETSMRQQFRDEYRETRSRRGRALLWLRAVWDVGNAAPSEIAREMTRDLTFAMRVYQRRWISTLLAVLALGFAIGISTGMFSVLNAILLRSLPFLNAEELVELWRGPAGPAKGRTAFYEWQGQTSYLAGAAAFSVTEVNLGLDSYTSRVKVAETSANFFSLLGTRAFTGRMFAENEDKPGYHDVAVISYGLWQDLFGADYGVAGKTVRLNGRALQVIGVAPPRFDYPANASIWTPTAFEFETIPKRGAFLFETIGRLTPGVSLRKGREMFEAEVRRTAPSLFDARESDRPRMDSIREELAGPLRPATWVLGGMILLVLIIACGNIAQLLLSRVSERRQELALRAALGASRARLLQQLITEAMVLTFAGAVLGLVVAHWTASMATLVAPMQLVSQEYRVLDWRVLGFAAGLAAITGIVFGVLPAWMAGRLVPAGSTLRTQASSRDRGAARVRAGLVAVQAALTLALLTSSIALGRTFLRLLDADLGFRTANVLTMTVSLQGSKHRSGAAIWQYYREALERLRAVRGVEAAGAVGYLPLADNVLRAEEFTLDSGATVRQILTNATMPGYFDAIGASMRAGRDFGWNEGGRPERAVIVNEAFATAAEAGAVTALVGRRLKAPWTDTPYTIVGVVSTARVAGPSHPGSPQIYWPIEEEPPPTLTFVARAAAGTDGVLEACRTALRGVDTGVPLFEVTTLETRLRRVLARPKFYTLATLFLAGFAAVLAAVGIYGTSANAVASRRHEIGVRMALGASQGRVRGMLLREGLTPAGLGILVGLAVVLGSGQLLRHLIVNAEEPSLGMILTAAILLLATGTLSVWSATTRILAIGPAEAVRSE